MAHLVGSLLQRQNPAVDECGHHVVPSESHLDEILDLAGHNLAFLVVATQFLLPIISIRWRTNHEGRQPDEIKLILMFFWHRVPGIEK